MRKIVIAMTACLVFACGTSWARGLEADLTVGANSIEGGFHMKNNLANGFWRAGGSALYTDDDSTEYKWLELDFTVGSETLQPGLTVEVGLKGIVGEAEEYGLSGDVGALAFAGRVGYVFPKRLMPIPLEVFSGVAYAPSVLSFRDTDRYLAYYMGVGVQIVENASIILKYNVYDV